MGWRMRFERWGAGDDLVLFFHGWGMSPESVRTLARQGREVVVFWDYESWACDYDFSAERPFRVVAWSLGVWAAHRVLPGTLCCDALAVNGTLFPIDAERGIAPAVFRGTIEGWGEESARKRFNQRVFGPDTPENVRDPAQQQCELRALERDILGFPAVKSTFFTRAVVGLQDRIFPAPAQRAAWGALSVPVLEAPLRHAPQDWEALVC